MGNTLSPYCIPLPHGDSESWVQKLQYIYIYVYMYMYIYICIIVYMYNCIYVYMYMYICIYHVDESAHSPRV